VINFCSNDYLGLANHPNVVDAAADALREWGFGMASVRFIAGTQRPHTMLEDRLAGFLGTDDAILYSSCFDANGGVFEALLDHRDAIVSDELNHASIIDGIRLSRARRLRYRNCDLNDLEAKLVDASASRSRLIVTDGVFSMDGSSAPLSEICDLAEKYDAMVMVDDSHGIGVLGPSGGGTTKLDGVAGRVDLISGTLGKAIGGASGGFVAGDAVLIGALRRFSRPYLFSNAVAPGIIAGSLAALDLVEAADDARAHLRRLRTVFEDLMSGAGFNVLPGSHPISPVLTGASRPNSRIASALLDRGVYVRAFSHPVVPEGAARVRVQFSSGHTVDDVHHLAREFVTARESTSRRIPGMVPDSDKQAGESSS